MKKNWVIMLVLAIIIIGIILGISIFNKRKNTKNNIIENVVNEVSEKVIDECTEEMEEIEEQAKIDVLEVDSEEEKISPNCRVILKKYYKGCNHTINEYIDIPENLVNKIEEDIKEQYPGWEIEKYSTTEIILYREYREQCGQHFVIRNNEGKVYIYRINENNEEELFETTEISVDYLTETDKIEIENGIRVNGKEELNQVIEDYE